MGIIRFVRGPAGHGGKNITIHWLLTITLLDTKDEWSSTLLGEDTFEKVLDTAEDKFLDTDQATPSQLLANARKKLS